MHGDGFVQQDPWVYSSTSITDFGAIGHFPHSPQSTFPVSTPALPTQHDPGNLVHDRTILFSFPSFETAPIIAEIDNYNFAVSQDPKSIYVGFWCLLEVACNLYVTLTRTSSDDPTARSFHGFISSCVPTAENCRPRPSSLGPVFQRYDTVPPGPAQ